MMDVLQLLSAGGDVAVIGLFFFTLRGFWKLEIRLVRLETVLKLNGKGDGGD